MGIIKFIKIYKVPLCICIIVLCYGILSHYYELSFAPGLADHLEKYIAAVAIIILTYNFNIEKAKGQIKSEAKDDFDKKLISSMGFLIQTSALYISTITKLLLETKSINAANAWKEAYKNRDMYCEEEVPEFCKESFFKKSLLVSLDFNTKNKSLNDDFNAAQEEFVSETQKYLDSAGITIKKRDEIIGKLQKKAAENAGFTANFFDYKRI